MQIADLCALLQIVDHYNGTTHKCDADFVLVLVIGADRRDKSAGFEMSTIEQCLVRRRRSNDYLAGGRCASYIGSGLTIKSVEGRHLSAEGFCGIAVDVARVESLNRPDA